MKMTSKMKMNLKTKPTSKEDALKIEDLRQRYTQEWPGQVQI